MPFVQNRDVTSIGQNRDENVTHFPRRNGFGQSLSVLFGKLKNALPMFPKQNANIKSNKIRVKNHGNFSKTLNVSAISLICMLATARPSAFVISKCCLTQ